VHVSPHRLSKIEFAIFSHDAGGAFYIAKLLNELEEIPKIHWYLDGPAKKILNNNFISKKSHLIGIDKLESKDISNCELVLTSSGWTSNYELEGIELARKLKIHSVTILDHWANYRRRLTRNGNLILPDKLWVFDDFALSTANQEFNGLTVEIEKISDPIEQELKRMSLEIPEENILLYLTEPISGTGKMDYSKLDYMVSETEAFMKFIDTAKKIKKDIKIVIRVHPSENFQFYKALLTSSGLKAEFSEIENPLLDITRAKFVVGMESIMLAWALMLNKETFTILPINGRKCLLPHTGIKGVESLNDFY